jgi:hypothetical protein
MYVCIYIYIEREREGERERETDKQKSVNDNVVKYHVVIYKDFIRSVADK